MLFLNKQKKFFILASIIHLKIDLLCAICSSIDWRKILKRRKLIKNISYESKK